MNPNKVSNIIVLFKDFHIEFVDSKFKIVSGLTIPTYLMQKSCFSS